MSDLVQASPSAPQPVAKPAVVSPPSGAEILAKAAEQKAEQDRLVADLVILPIRRSDTIGKLVAALAKAQGALAGVKRDADNPFFKSKYATLSAGIDVIRQPFAEQELAYIQLPTARGRIVIIRTLLAHSSGEWIEEALVLTAERDTPQAVVAAVTYGRRCGLFAMAGLAPVDDDGEAATHTLPKETKWDKGGAAPHQVARGVSDEAPDGPELPEASGKAVEPGHGEPTEGGVGSASTPSLVGAPPQGQLRSPGAVMPPAKMPVAQPRQVAQPRGTMPVGTSTPPPPGRPPMRAPGTGEEKK